MPVDSATPEAPELPADVQANITRIVRTLMARDGIRFQKELAPILGVDESGITRRMKGTWSVEDVVLLAEHFQVPPGRFFTTPERLFVQDSRWYSEWAEHDVREGYGDAAHVPFTADAGESLKLTA